MSTKRKDKTMSKNQKQPTALDVESTHKLGCNSETIIDILQEKYNNYLSENSKIPKYLIINSKYEKLLKFHYESILGNNACDPNCTHEERFMGCLLCSPHGGGLIMEFAT